METIAITAQVTKGKNLLLKLNAFIIFQHYFNHCFIYLKAADQPQFPNIEGSEWDFLGYISSVRHSDIQIVILNNEHALKHQMG